MQIRKHHFSFIVGLLISFLLFTPVVTTAQSTQGSFSVTPHYPSQQTPDIKGYYDLTVQKGETIDLHFSLKNPSDKDITISNTISPATTNKNGQIIYGPTKNIAKSSANYNFTELIEGPNETKVLANTTTDLILHLHAPHDEFQGILLGGIEFEQKKEKSDTQTIQNIVAYDIPILLRQTTQEVPLSFTFEKLDQRKLSDEHLLIQNIQNRTPTMAKKGSIVTEIRKKDRNEVLYKEANNDVNFAPSSEMDFAISLADQSFSAGNYTAKTVIQFGEQKWETTAPFTIEAPLERTNATSVISTTKTHNVIYPFIIIFLVLIIVALVYNRSTSKK